MNVSKLLFAVTILLIGLVANPFSQLTYAAGTNYYVDSVSGSDNNSGTSPTSPWKTLTKVQNFRFQPGDTINFKRDSTWTGCLTIRDSGTSSAPITFRDYGTGARPTISNPSTGVGNFAIRIYGSWIVVQGFLLKDSGDAAVKIEPGANRNIVQDIEVTNAGFGVYIEGQFNLVTRNYAYDLKMVKNTPGGDDDYGAAGFVIANTDNEVSHNRCARCRAPSYDYGYDGGVIELWANADNAYIHHNHGTESDGFLEAGGGSARNVRVAYNVSDNNYLHFACLHNAGTFATIIENFRIENNTISNTTAYGWSVLNCMDAPVTPTQLIFRNNIVRAKFRVFNQSTFTRANNIYHMLDGASVGFTLLSGEMQADPMFAVNADCPFVIQASSPAISKGVPLGYVVDFHGNPVGIKPAIGSHEYHAPHSPTRFVFLPLIVR